MRERKFVRLIPLLFAAIVLFVVPSVSASSSWFAGGQYNLAGNTGNWVDSNTGPVLKAPALENTFIWQGATTNTNYFVQEVLRMHCQAGGGLCGWRVEFWSFNPSGNVVDEVLTNELQSPGCSEQYIQYFQSSNSIFAAMLGYQASQCESWSQSWTFNDVSYGTTMTYPEALFESYDYACSDFQYNPSVQFTNGIYGLSGGTYGYPMFYVYDTGPSCIGVSAGYRYATVTFPS
jgi:hypothetical protein